MQTRTIKTRIARVAVVAMIGVGLTGCDGHHDPLDTSMKVGHILCTDGKTRSYEDYVAYFVRTARHEATRIMWLPARRR